MNPLSGGVTSDGDGWVLIDSAHRHVNRDVPRLTEEAVHGILQKARARRVALLLGIAQDAACDAWKRAVSNLSSDTATPSAPYSGGEGVADNVDTHVKLYSWSVKTGIVTGYVFKPNCETVRFYCPAIPLNSKILRSGSVLTSMKGQTYLLGKRRSY